MTLLSPEPVRRRWQRYRGRPFWRLVELFAARIFRGGGDSDSEGLDLGIGLVLTLLAMPGGFVSLFLLNKYGSFLQWLRGMTNVDALSVSLPDEYFFIVLSMVVTGAVAVWRGDAIFPDRRDYINLVPLPIAMRTIFFANLVAVLFLVGLIALDVNAASCILFPAVVAATQTKFVFFLKFAVVHAVGVVLASVFSFFAVFAALGLLLAVLPARAFRRISAYVRGTVVVYLVTLLYTSFAVPDALWRAKGPLPTWALVMPSSWFLSLCQLWRGRANPVTTQLAALALPGVGIVVVVALSAYAVGYRRHFVRIAELGESAGGTSAKGRSRLTLVLDRLVLPTPFQRGGFRFVWKTLLRSEPHRLMLTGVAGLAAVLASQALMTAFEGENSWQAAALTPEALSIPFIISFLMIIGLRAVFEIPAELRANWIFQLMLDPHRQECEPLARRVILSVVLPGVVLISFPAYFYLEGVRIAVLHTLVVVTWCMLLTNLVLIRFRKLPFTCTPPVFKQHSIVALISCCFGFLIYAVSTPEFESAALLQPARMIGLVPVALIAWYIPRHLANSSMDFEKKLVFEESAGRTFEVLRLSD